MESIKNFIRSGLSGRTEIGVIPPFSKGKPFKPRSKAITSHASQVGF